MFLAITLIKKRLRDAFGEEVGKQYQVVGESRRAGIAARRGASGRAGLGSVSGTRYAKRTRPFARSRTLAIRPPTRRILDSFSLSGLVKWLVDRKLARHLGT